MRSHKMTFAAMSFAVALMVGTAAFAQSTTTPTVGTPPEVGPNGQAQGGPPGGHMGNPAMHAAWESCKGTVAKDAEGHPDHAAMKACMTAKGFTPPEHGAGGPPPPGGQGMGAPPSSTTAK